LTHLIIEMITSLCMSIVRAARTGAMTGTFDVNSILV